MKKFIIPIVAAGMMALGCTSGRTVVNNHYDDGIYHNPADRKYAAPRNAPEQGETVEQFSLNDLEDEQITTNPDAGSGVDYYDPEDTSPQQQLISSGGDVVVNNYYSTPSFRQPMVNTGFGWNNWGGWGVSVGFGSPFYRPWGYYSPWAFDPWYNPWVYDPFYDPFFGPSWGWRASAMYGPYGWRGNYWNRPFYGGYNCYWRNSYNGFYYSGGGDNFNSRNVTYVQNVSPANRTGSYNNRFNSADRSISRKNTGSSRGDGRQTLREQQRNPRSSQIASASRFSDRNLSAYGNRSNLEDARAVSSRRNTTVRSRQLGTENLERGRSATAAATNRSSSYNYVKSRALGEPVNRSSATERSLERSSTNVRRNTRSYSRDQYRRVEERRATPTPERERDLYQSRESRTKTYERRSTPERKATPQRSTTPRRSSPSRSYEPSRNRSYTPQRSQPSRSSEPSRSYTPSRSGGSNNRSYTPSRSSGSGRSYTPSRSGGSRSSSPSRSRGGSSRSRTSGGR